MSPSVYSGIFLVWPAALGFRRHEADAATRTTDHGQLGAKKTCSNRLPDSACTNTKGATSSAHLAQAAADMWHF